MTSDRRGQLTWRMRPRDLNPERKKVIDTHMPSEDVGGNTELEDLRAARNESSSAWKEESGLGL